MGVVVSFFGTATVSMSAWYPIHKTLSHIIEVGLDKNQGGHLLVLVDATVRAS